MNYKTIADAVERELNIYGDTNWRMEVDRSGRKPVITIRESLYPFME
jgi:hypothetical protein